MADLMRRTGSRTVKVNKAKLIEKIKENKEAHIIAYAKAIEAYKKEALRQLSELTIKAENGETNLWLQLTTPIDNAKSYDKILDIFEWELDDVVELEQREFNEYILDETESARQAMVSNSMYLR